MTIARSITSLAASAAVLALTACGGGGAGDAAGAGQPDDTKQLAFARCLREHGIDAPDPKTSPGGRVSQAIRIPKGFAPSRLREITQDCAKKTGGGPKPLSKEDRAKALDQALKFARCMRAHGIDVPDPQAGGGGIRIAGRPGSDVDPESPAFQRAQKACASELPRFGTSRSRGGKDDGPSTQVGP